MRLALSVLAVAALAATLSGDVSRAAERSLILATTTSTDNSGLLSHLHPDFEKRTGIQVKVVAKGTGASLQLARDGNADVVLVHAREQEEQFVAEGHGVMRRDVMYNDFIILGPQADPAGVRGIKDPAVAMASIANATGRHFFISRGDGSGTHIAEQQLWRRTGLPLGTDSVTVLANGQQKAFDSARPLGDWYFSVGQGMGKTIMIATEKRAYTFADRGTYYAFALAEPAKTNLVILNEGHPSLHNPYGVMAVNPKRHAQVNFAGARQYIEWITSPEVQQMIGRYTYQGKVLFHPNAKGAEQP